MSYAFCIAYALKLGRGGTSKMTDVFGRENGKRAHYISLVSEAKRHRNDPVAPLCYSAAVG